jgi:hypothetical protein
MRNNWKNELASVFATVLKYSIETYVTNFASTSDGTVEKFLNQIEFLKDDSLRDLVGLARQNRITLILQDMLLRKMSRRIGLTGNAILLKKYLEERLAQDRLLEVKRNQILKRLAELLRSSSIDYVFFKTLNRFGGVGVDIDLLIRRSAYSRCVKLLLENGFDPIDSLAKLYATGFVARDRKNPIIVDLHTDIAILGIRYFSPETLLNNKSEIEITFPSEKGGEEFTKLNVLNEKTSAVVAMAHSVIKEGNIRASDVIEVCQQLWEDRQSFQHCALKEHLEVAYLVFETVLSSFLPEFVYDHPEIFSIPKITRSGNVLQLEELGFLSKLAVLYVKKSLSERNEVMPVRIPTLALLLAFFHTVKERGALGISAWKAFSTIGLGTNPARAREKIVHLIS